MCLAAIDAYPIERPGEIDPEAIQSLACAVLHLVWRDAGSHHRLEVLGAVAFCYSADLSFWCDLGNLSEKNRAMLRQSIEARAAISSRPRASRRCMGVMARGFYQFGGSRPTAAVALFR